MSLNCRPWAFNAEKKVHLSWKSSEFFCLKFIRRPWCCLCKLFKFLFSSPEPLGHIYPNLAQSTLGERDCLFRSPIYMIQGKWLRKSKNRGGSFKNIFIKNQITYIIQSLSFYRFLMYVRFKLICSIHDPQGLGRAPYY